MERMMHRANEDSQDEGSADGKEHEDEEHF
jgi:hypothetical protein